MIRTLFLSAALSFAALPALAGDGCDGCPGAKEATTSVWAKQIADLEAKAAAGDKRADAALAAAREACGTDCNKTMTGKVTALETKAAGGDAEAKKTLESMRWTMVFASVRAAPLSEQVTFYSKACDHGCEISKNSLAVMMKETGAKDRAALLATVQDWEAKAAKGCPDCTKKIASLRAKLAPSKAPAKVALSERVGALVKAAAKGDKAASEKVTKIAETFGKKPENLVAAVAEFEAMASKGCGASKAKLADVAKLLGDSCDDCDGCGECGKECKETCPVESKPVSQ